MSEDNKPIYRKRNVSLCKETLLQLATLIGVNASNNNDFPIIEMMFDTNKEQLTLLNKNIEITYEDFELWLSEYLIEDKIQSIKTPKKLIDHLNTVYSIIDDSLGTKRELAIAQIKGMSSVVEGLITAYIQKKTEDFNSFDDVVKQYDDKAIGEKSYTEILKHHKLFFNDI